MNVLSGSCTQVTALCSHQDQSTNRNILVSIWTYSFLNTLCLSIMNAWFGKRIELFNRIESDCWRKNLFSNSVGIVSHNLWETVNLIKITSCAYFVKWESFIADFIRHLNDTYSLIKLFCLILIPDTWIMYNYKPYWRTKIKYH